MPSAIIHRCVNKRVEEELKRKGESAVYNVYLSEKTSVSREDKKSKSHRLEEFGLSSGTVTTHDIFCISLPCRNNPHHLQKDNDIQHL